MLICSDLLFHFLVTTNFSFLICNLCTVLVCPYYIPIYRDEYEYKFFSELKVLGLIGLETRSLGFYFASDFCKISSFYMCY